MADRKDKDKDNLHYITQDQVCELMEKHKAVYKEMLNQQENNFKACLRTLMDRTNSRVDAIFKDLQEIKVSLQYTQKEVDDLKDKTNSLSSICKSTQDDIQKLAESMIIMDGKSDSLDAQARRQNLVIDGISEEDNEKWLG